MLALLQNSNDDLSGGRVGSVVAHALEFLESDTSTDKLATLLSRSIIPVLQPGSMMPRKERDHGRSSESHNRRRV